MERVCWQDLKHDYGSHNQLKAWDEYQRAYQRWRQAKLTTPQLEQP